MGTGVADMSGMTGGVGAVGGTASVTGSRGSSSVGTCSVGAVSGSVGASGSGSCSFSASCGAVSDSSSGSAGDSDNLLDLIALMASFLATLIVCLTKLSRAFMRSLGKQRNNLGRHDYREMYGSCD